VHLGGPSDFDGLARGHGTSPEDQVYERREILTMIKRTLDFEQLQAQTALELPDREVLALVNVFIVDVLSGNTIQIDVQNIQTAVTVCALVNVITVLTGAQLDCQTLVN
jgi:hypothetical protein